MKAPSQRRADPSSPPIRIGISACLLGQTVRYDGGHKRDPFLTEVLAPFVEWVPVCPEVECGFGTPRPAMRLVRTDEGVRLLTLVTAADLTDRMERYASRRVAQLEREALSGYVLKKNSPSCGLERVKVYGVRGGVDRSGRGLFAGRLLARFPSLPIEEEGRLSDPRLRENFIERVFAYARLRDLFTPRWTVGSLMRFHTSHKLLLMAHSPRAYAELGRFVAGASGLPRSDVAARYTEQFMSAMTLIATPRRHVNVLQHCAGYFKRLLSPSSKAELQQVIDDYRRGIVPLVVPITLLRHHIRVHDVTYLADQEYLDPHPKELMLRNHV